VPDPASAGASVQGGLRAFLDVLFPDGCGGLIELRGLPSATRTFVTVDDCEAVEAFAADHRNENVYIGIASRKDAAGGGVKQCVELHAIWIDVDYKTTAEAEAREKVAAFPLPPSVVINSGGGIHAYWAMREPFTLPTEAPAAYALLKRLARHFDGDPAVAEPARMLRLPGTANHKYMPPRPVTIETVDPARRYDPSEFDEWLPALPSSTKPNGSSGHQPFVAPERIVDGERNTTLYRTDRVLRARGLSREAVAAALAEENETKCVPPLPSAEVAAIAAHVSAQADTPGFAADILTEAGAAERFCREHGDDVRFDHRRQRWLI